MILPSLLEQGGVTHEQAEKAARFMRDMMERGYYTRFRAFGSPAIAGIVNDAGSYAMALFKNGSMFSGEVINGMVVPKNRIEYDR